MMYKRKIRELKAPMKAVAEVEIPADAEFCGIRPSVISLPSVVLIFGAPEGAVLIKRKLWMVPVGAEASVEAQNGQLLGVDIVSIAEGNNVAVAMFLETQKQALERAQNRRPSPPLR